MSHPSFPTGSFLDAPPDVAMAAIAQRQHGQVTIAQLRRALLDTAAVAKRVRAGRLHRTRRGVYAVGHASLSREAHWMAAVLEAGEGAALSHLAAAALWEVWRRRVPGIDVVSRRRSSLSHVHWSRHLDRRDVTKRHGIPVTTVPRTLVDLTDVLTAEQLANVIHEAAFRNRFSARATRAAMERANGRTNLQVLERRSSSTLPETRARGAPTRTESWRRSGRPGCPSRWSTRASRGSRWTCTGPT